METWKWCYCLTESHVCLLITANKQFKPWQGRGRVNPSLYPSQVGRHKCHHINWLWIFRFTQLVWCSSQKRKWNLYPNYHFKCLINTNNYDDWTWTARIWRWCWQRKQVGLGLSVRNQGSRLTDKPWLDSSRILSPDFHTRRIDYS